MELGRQDRDDGNEMAGMRRRDRDDGTKSTGPTRWDRDRTEMSGPGRDKDKGAGRRRLSPGRRDRGMGPGWDRNHSIEMTERGQDGTETR